MKKNKLDKDKRKELFTSYYSDIYGTRWQDIETSFLKPSETTEYTKGLLQAYYLDPASIIAAESLIIKEGDTVLDMCAAPGGKTLILASKLNKTGLLVSNDRSRDRKIRLDKVINEHLEYTDNIKTTNYDASRWSLYEKDKYDAILLDAPCSSERHVLNSEKHLAMWSASRPKRLALEQYALLSAASHAVKVGGYILYSTCSINKKEDEEVIEKLMKRRNECFCEIELDIPSSERQKYGYLILPDKFNIGPIYLCLVKRIA